MNVVIFGASGMIGRGALLESLDHPDVVRVLSIGRRKIEDVDHDKLTQLNHDNFEDFEPIAEQLRDFDACFWCLGIASSGMKEPAYTRITYDFTMAAARVLLRENPEMCFCFVSGAGTDDTEQGRAMWARVKGKTENALKAMTFKEVVLFRPAYIRPMRGSKPRGAAYRTMYAVMRVLNPLIRATGGGTSTVEVGRAMIGAAKGLSDKQILNSKDINVLAAKLSS